MTLVIGVNGRDGLVLASDSEVVFSRGAPVKRMNANKIRRLDGDVAIGGAGTLLFIRKAIGGIRTKVEEKEKNESRKLGVEEIADLSEGVMLALYKTYNIERSRYLYDITKAQAQEEIFDPTLVMGGYENNASHLYMIFPEGVAEPVDDYCTIGSGAAYAEHLLSKFYSQKLSVENLRTLSVYVIKQVETIDPNVGGPVGVVSIGSKGYRETTEKELTAITASIRERDEAIGKVTKKILFKLNRNE
jgi:20S proteasome alpha/beta subunit